MTRRNRLSLMLCLSLMVGACANNTTNPPPPITPPSGPPPPVGSLKTVTYTASTTEIPNPERGFYADSEYYDSTNDAALTVSSIGQIVAAAAQKGFAGVRLIHRSYFLPNLITSAHLPSTFLGKVQQDLQSARSAGVKLILRFAYRTVALEDCKNLPPSDQPACEAKARAEHDPTKATILAHLEDLRGVLTGNADVIAYVDAGLLGTYGEWAYATDQGVGSLLSGFPNQLAPDALYGSSDGTVPNANTKEIITKFLDVLPAARAIAIRTPAQRITLLQGSVKASLPAPGLADSYDPRTWNPAQTTITDATAFSSTATARLGSHNDCFLASGDDFGTYYYGNYPGVTTADQISREKDYLSANNLFVPMGGETCAVNAGVPIAQYPAYAAKELRKMRWSTLNTDYNADVLKAMGPTLAEAKKNLGYRLVLVDSSVPVSAAQNQSIPITFTVRNDGYAPPFNPRKLEVVFEKAGSAPIRRSVNLDRASSTDPRFWKPAKINADGSTAGVTYTATLNVAAPDAAGTYTVSLNLPDAFLPDDARYSIRLASDGLWDAAKLEQTDPGAAFNALGQTIKIP
jgi:Domain of unknown function (DUF4832)/Domain of unknown function (DUF4874)